MLIFLALISTLRTFGLLRGARGAFGRCLAFERRYAGRAVSQIEHRDLDGAAMPLQWDRDIGSLHRRPDRCRFTRHGWANANR